MLNITLEARDLTKYYGKIKGVQHLNLRVKQGEIYGFLGPNGAGKTTTIRCFLDIIRPTSGKCLIEGENVVGNWKLREKIGYIPGEIVLYDHLTIEQYFRFLDRVHHRDCTKKEELIERFKVDVKRKMKGLSKGNKQKVAIVSAFMHDPEILILDEPTSSLDPILQQEFYKMIQEEQQRGKTIFFSSHNLYEVQRICSKVSIIKEGQLIVEEDVKNLGKKVLQRMVVKFEQESDYSGLDGIIGITGLSFKDDR
ncbi:MAG: ABC transporter ATP-binding protein, partial [Candidatus Heimdallarchaeaceae archaeon]